MNTYDYLKDSRGRLSASKIKNLSADSRKEIISKNPGLLSDSIPEHLYWIAHQLSDYPVSCKTCHQPVKTFQSFALGYTAQFCSLGCMQRNPLTTAKKKSTTKMRHGVDSIWQIPQVVEKRKNTCNIKYGMGSPMHLARAAAQLKYGVGHVSHMPGVIEKRLETVLRISAARLEEELADRFVLSGYTRHDVPMNFTCRRCDLTITALPSKDIRCPVCDKNAVRSSLERTIIANITGHEMTVGKGLRLDGNLYFPDILWSQEKLIVETDGNYWHAELRGQNKLKSFHKKKAYAAAGFKSLFFFEDEVLFKLDIVLSLIRANLGIFTQTIFARKCEFWEIPGKMANTFYDAHHLQGACRQKKSYGLFYEGELVAAASFGPARYNKHATWELLRLCFRPGVKVIGGSARLMSRSLELLGPGSLISYSDNRISDGDVYSRLGFKLISAGAPSYFYVERKNYLKRWHRSRFQKKALMECPEDVVFTEWELAQRRGLDRLWDCGSKTWLLKR
jgi:hypothetical protein